MWIKDVDNSSNGQKHIGQNESSITIFLNSLHSRSALRLEVYGIGIVDDRKVT